MDVTPPPVLRRARGGRDHDRTRVYLTVDVECAEERPDGRGGIRPPLGYDLRVWGRFRNQRQELGVTFIADALERSGLRGTFFVEALGAATFGEPGLAEVCETLRARGHDVELHLHPVLRRPNWRSLGERPPSDDIAEYPLDQQTAFLREGLDLLSRAGLPRDEVRAYRAGNFGASEETWRAMARAGLLLSSNHNPSSVRGACRIQRPPAAGVYDTGEGVWELPISTFQEQPGGFRHLQINAVSFAEMRHYLIEARRLGIGEVTIVMHPFELFHVDDPKARTGRPNPVNIARLEALCRFLGDNAQEFQGDTVGALARRLGPPAAAALSALNRHADLPRGQRRLRALRVLEQARKRLGARFPVVDVLLG